MMHGPIYMRMEKEIAEKLKLYVLHNKEIEKKFEYRKQKFL